MKHWKKILAALAAGWLLLALLCAGIAGPCWSGWARWGVLVERCPTGVLPVINASVSSIGRGVRGSVWVRVNGQLYDEQLQPTWQEPMDRVSVTLRLRGPDGKEQEIEPVSRWSGGADGEVFAPIELDKALVDGDYVLVVEADTPAGVVSADVLVPFYKPALAHVLTAAPLYKPGQTIQFRSVLLDKGTLAPLAERPGRWIVTNPAGEVVLEEKSKTDAWGVASSDFPLTTDAEVGDWKITFRSGDASDEVGVQVRTFQLPKMAVELTSAKAWWTVGERPHLDGVVKYASGAPVAGAGLRVRLQGMDAWPPPSAWLDERTLSADGAGRYTLDLDAIPADLVGLSHLRVRVDATDVAGEAASATADLTLSVDPLKVDAVTELGDGMVPDMNNRLFVRVTTPDGARLTDKKLRLRPAWDAAGTWLDATTDADGVARFQLDPGSPVTVTEPAMPVRPVLRERRKPVELVDVDDELRSDLGLADRAVLDRWVVGLGGCAAGTPGEDVRVELRLAWSRGGERLLTSAESGTSNSGRVVRCVEAAIGALRPAPGIDRLWRLSLQFNDSGAPHVTVDPSADAGATPDVSGVIAASKGCLDGLPNGLSLPGRWLWSFARGAKTAPLRLLYADDADEAPIAAVACIARKAPTIELPAGAETDRRGDFGLLVRAAESAAGPPAPTTWPGFEFLAAIEGVGETRLRLHQGNVPPLRLRFDDVVVDAGSSIGLTAIRGPAWSGDFPKKMDLRQGDRVLDHFDFDPEKRTATVAIPPEASGFASVEWAGARGVLYIRPKETLSVRLETGKGSWKPGSTVQLVAHTTNGTAPVAAGLTLAGLDQSMGQLVPLVAPDDFSRVTVLAQMDSPAFGVLDAKALQGGLIAGANAQQATVLRIASLPPVSPGADRVDASAQSAPDVETPLTEAFYGVYGEARSIVRAWEREAPAAELLTNEKMAALWKEALQKHPAEDPFGRSLRLRYLPQGLLALTDPRVMVEDAARLPEDIDNWQAWVAREAP